MAGRDGRPDEDELIARYFRPLAAAPGALGLKDDAATLPVPSEGSELVLTTDALVAGVHFFPDDPPDTVARKALRVNISDLVAKGARPVAYLLTLALATDWTPDWVESFAEGLAADQDEFGIVLYGGDTVRTPGPPWVSITAIGFAPEGQVPRRTGASPGQRVFVTGTIGDAALGLILRRDPDKARRWDLTRTEREHLLDRYLLPEPKLASAPLVASFATAAMDVSDGLAIDLARLAKASGVSAVVDVARVPLSPGAVKAVAAEEALLRTVVTGGDDYEVLFAVAAEDGDAAMRAATNAGLRITEVGRIVERGPAPLRVVRQGADMIIDRLGFRHF